MMQFDRFQDLLNGIEEADVNLLELESRLSTDFDMSQPGWLDRVRDLGRVLEEKSTPIVEPITRKLVDHFTSLDAGERKAIIDKLGNTKSLKKHAGLRGGGYVFEDIIIFFIIRNFGPDARDALEELRRILEIGKAHDAHYLQKVKHLIQYADDRDVHGLGSMKLLLNRVVERAGQLK